VVAVVAARHGFAGPLIVFHECLREAESRGEETYYATNTHWSVRGNEIVAHVLAERLAEAWDLGAGRVPAGDTPNCRSDAPVPGPEVERAVGAVLARAGEAAAMRDRITAAAREGERFRSTEAVAELLARAGMRPSTGYVDGGIDYASRGLGRVGRATVRLHGHARDIEDPSGWLLLIVFRKGELAGIGFTRPGDATPDGAFELEILEEAPPGIWGADARLVAVTPKGEWSELPVTVGPLYQRLVN
jgi:hypothetical protein